MAIKPHPHFRVHLSERRPNTVTIKDFLCFWVWRFIVVDEFFGFVNQSTDPVPKIYSSVSLSQIHLFIDTFIHLFKCTCPTTVHRSIIYIYLWLQLWLITPLSMPFLPMFITYNSKNIQPCNSFSKIQPSLFNSHQIK